MSQDETFKFNKVDKFTKSIQNMRNEVGKLSKDVAEYRKIQSLTFDKRVELKFEINKAKKELEGFEKSHFKSAEQFKKAVEKKQKSINNLTKEYKRMGEIAEDAIKTEKKLGRIDKAKSFAKTGALGMLGDAAKDSAQQFIGSKFGEKAGNVAGSAMAGAAMGSALGPLGAALGAAIGGLAGVIKNSTEERKAKDEMFQQEVKDLFSNVKEDMKNTLKSGIDMSTIASDQINSLSIALKSEEKGKAMYDDIKELSIVSPYQDDFLINTVEQMLANGANENTVMSDLKMLGDVAMGDQGKLDALSYAFTQTQKSGKLTEDDLTRFNDAGFDPLEILAKEQGVELEQMKKNMADGLVTASDVSKAFKIATSEGGDFYGAMSKKMDSYAGKMSVLTDLKSDIDKSMGDGYTAEREKGIEKEIEFYSGESGEKMKEAYSLIGQYEADLENKHQQAIVDSISAVQETDAYKKAESEGNGAEMGRLVSEAKVNAELEYKNSEAYKKQVEADLALVESIQNNTAIKDGYFEYGRLMAEQFSLGYAAFPQGEDEPSSWFSRFWGGNGNATGLGRVPRDGFYKLHEGEKVVTKVNAQKGNGSVSVKNEFNIFNYGQSTYEITKEILANINRASESFAGGYA